MIAAAKLGILMLYRFFVVSCVLVTACSATVGSWWFACSPVDGRCPPGFLPSDQGNNCVCGALPIDRCDEQHCRAYLRSGYWAGYVPEHRYLRSEPHSTEGAGTNGSRFELYTGKCPRGFCENGEVGKPLLLPGPNSSAKELNQIVCGTTRKGILCGECSPGFGPGVNLFLAPCVHCATDPLSQVGWLLWLLLEVLPLLLMLAAFLIFDINLLAGPLNSYLLYAQFIAASFPISTAGPIVISNSASSVIVRFFYVIFFGIFNLQFFSFLLPPFCISPGAANLDQVDVILIKTFTRLLPFIVILAIIALQWCNQYGYCRLTACWHYLSYRFKVVRWLTSRLTGRSTAHGLSALFVLVYTRFLSYGGVLCDHNVIEPSSKSNASAIAVLELQGNLFFFQAPKHIVIAVFILLLIIFMILLPTCLLLAYPALPQLQAKLQHSKYKVLRCVTGQKCLNVFSRPSIQHFGDLFQSSYKDNCRFFAGVLLLMRFVVVLAWNSQWSQSLQGGYVIMTALSLVVLTLHSLIRPHRRGWINVVDSLLYAHLAIVNLLGVYIFSNPNSRSAEESWMTLYLFAFFAPGVYLVLYVANVLRKRWWPHRRLLSSAVSAQATGDDAYVHIEHVVEVDPQIEEDPVREGVREVEKSYGSVTERNSRHQELWFTDN